jgi:protein phosphatase PTC2/3
MEDAHAAILDLQTEQDGQEQQAAAPDKRMSFFGVYDGHGGEKVAQFAGENIHKIVAKQEAYSKGNIEQALKDGFLATDRAILNGECSRNRAKPQTLICTDTRYEDEVSGCTASVGVISKEKIWVVCYTTRFDTCIIVLTGVGKCWRLKICSRRQRQSEAFVV